MQRKFQEFRNLVGKKKRNKPLWNIRYVTTQELALREGTKTFKEKHKAEKACAL